MRDLLPFIVSGLASGSVYALAGMGLVLTFRTSGIFNFAHGAQAALAAYVMYDLRDLHGWPWPAAALAAVLFAGVAAGFVLERMAWLLASAAAATRIVATVGLLVGLQGLIVVRYGAAAIPFRPFLPTGVAVTVSGVHVRADQLIVMALALVTAVALFTFFRRARLGVAMQAVVDDPALLGLQGESAVSVRRSAWVLGSCFAAGSGLLLAPVLNLDVNILTLLVVQAFGAAALGAFNSLVGTYAGGLAIGVVADVAKKYVTGTPALSQLPSTLPFLVLFVVLLVIPKRRLIERGARVVRRALPPRRFRPPVLAAGGLGGVAVLLAIPVIASGKLSVYTTALAFVILFASLGLLVQGSDQVSLCHMAFAGVGAAGFVHAHEAGLPWLVAVLVGGLVAVPVGAIVAIPAIRLSGVYLAIATFGFGILMERIFYTRSFMFGPTLQVAAPRPGLGRLATDTGYYYVVLAVALAAVGVVVLVRRARLGRLLSGLADSPAALTAFGTDTNITRLFVFCISALLAGVAGAVMAPITGSASGGTFNFGISLVLLAVLFIAGRQPVLSAFVAAVAYAVIPAYIENATLVQATPVFFGAAALLVATNPLQAVAARTARRPRPAERTDRTPARSRFDAAPVAPVAASGVVR
jgi:branched-subunit amino acid ABC-type transport system permease component